MYIAYNSLLIALIWPLSDLFVYDKKGEKILLVFTLTPLLMIDKKGEKYFKMYLVYMHVFLTLLLKGEKNLLFMHICFVLQIGEKEFDEFYA